ncbi:Hypothetical_protein [Hexamita inflata]|uniref:Hypothetical_protein n=1 Tax=Hexamita inflata TaxID=28002 RepID=A0AA86RDL3_9EUKA|nr:Hypothetical protein HINF_LOCUS63275 [Hexamita inflata]
MVTCTPFTPALKIEINYFCVAQSAIINFEYLNNVKIYNSAVTLCLRCWCLIIHQMLMGVDFFNYSRYKRYYIQCILIFWTGVEWQYKNIIEQIPLNCREYPFFQSKFQNVEPLKDLVNLQGLYLAQNKIKDFTPTKNHPNFKKYFIGGWGGQ